MSNEEDSFHRILTDVAYKLANILKTQSPRFLHLWNKYLYKINPQPHVPRLIPFEKEKFIESDEYKAKTLKIIENAAVDIFYSIKSLSDTLYNKYFINSELFLKDFSERDQRILPYLCARELYGNLLEFLKLEHEIAPMKYLVLAKNFQMLKMKGVSFTEVMNGLKKSEIEIDPSELTKIMDEIEQDGIIEGYEEGTDKEYILKSAVKLSPEGDLKYQEHLSPLLSWCTLIWRSFYNIRELNTPVPDDYEWASYLKKVLPRAATQGFKAAHYVIQNLAKYYKMVTEEENKS